MIEKGIFLFKFNSKDKMDEILVAGPWSYYSFPLILQPWLPEVDIDPNKISSFSIWVQLPLLKIHLWSQSVLSKIASVIGKPICTDGITAVKGRLSYARICVEINPHSELPDMIKLKGPGGVAITQKVEYEWVPSRCTYCECFGHSIEKCRKPKPVWLPKEPKEIILLENDSSHDNTEIHQRNERLRDVNEANQVSPKSQLEANPASVPKGKGNAKLIGKLSVLSDEPVTKISITPIPLLQKGTVEETIG
ncbi:OLC1v1032322C1 [Oldenlandia corymbosa var. corymbosa]|uniref:OLC1v1032322C1 n=1 Tax=Oldenlandia corymbosa var. corymbosa TaxID=529605 RepID=A0AAV1CLF5_OLDCO|nr:OLC1v1032322C1 [Oldenlandia corymbosa var. corymbosa]